MWEEVAVFKFVDRLITQPPLKSRDVLRQEILRRYDEIGHAVAQRYVRGNVNIKAGRFLTKEDIQARKKEHAP
jgi:hypothetical protein